MFLGQWFLVLNMEIRKRWCYFTCKNQGFGNMSYLPEIGVVCQTTCTVGCRTTQDQNTKRFSSRNEKHVQRKCKHTNSQDSVFKVLENIFGLFFSSKGCGLSTCSSRQQCEKSEDDENVKCHCTRWAWCKHHAWAQKYGRTAGDGHPQEKTSNSHNPKTPTKQPKSPLRSCSAPVKSHLS